MPPDQETRNSRAWFKDPDESVKPARHKDDGGLFGWTVIILLFIGIAIACWIGSFYVFGNPEKPLSYRLLTKLDKLDPPKRFELTAAPRGEFLRAPQLIERYGSMRPRQLARTNQILLRNYLRNFKPADGLVPYVIGTFNILDSYELGGGDFFTSGVVAVAESKDDPKLLIEQIFPAGARSVPALHRTLLTGLDIDLKRENELAAVIHAEQLPDGRVKLTTVSVLYPSYESASADGTFTLEPPESLNVAAGLPVVGADRQRDADAKHEHFRRKAKLAATGKDAKTPAADPFQTARLMRVEKPLAVDGSGFAAAPQATPVPVLPAVAAVKEVEVRAAIPVDSVPTAIPVAVAIPVGSPAPLPSPGASPTPPKAIAAAGSRVWNVYDPGRMPRGRLVGVSDIQELARRGTAGERLYLRGDFNVTAAGGDRAVMRAPQRPLGFGGRTDNVRVIVQYPEGIPAPTNGASISRDGQRPFQIMDVRESAGGQVNVYVREVTRP